MIIEINLSQNNTEAVVGGWSPIRTWPRFSSSVRIAGDRLGTADYAFEMLDERVSDSASTAQASGK
jgi:hypothetical protein